MNNQPQQVCYDEDEIDLRELFRTIGKYKIFIIVFTLAVTLLAGAYAFLKQPVYEVRSNVRVGYIKDAKSGKKRLVDDIGTIVKTLKVVFRVDKEDKVKQEKFVSDVANIEASKKIKGFITIKTEGANNEVALTKNKEVVAYLQKMYEPKIKQYIVDKKAQIDELKNRINDIKNLNTESLKDQIEQKRGQIKKLQDKLSFYENVKILVLRKKIAFHKQKLKEYQASVDSLVRSGKKSKESTMQMIASIQMVNYQNLILNSQNKIEDYQTEIERIRTENIKAIELQIQQIQDSIKRLKYKLDVSLKNQIQLIKDKIAVLEYDITKQNVQNSVVVGEYIVKDKPAKPKKKLIIVVAFVTGLVLSIFLVFFIEFIKGFKEEEEGAPNQA